MVLQQIAALTFNLSLALLGAEVPLSANVELVPAAYSQAPISAATNGGDFLVLWKSEERFDRPPVLHLGRIAADGTPRAAFPRSFPSTSFRFPPFPSALLAANGDEYLLAYISGTNAYVQRVGDDGQPLDAPRLVSQKSLAIYGLVFNGSVFLLLVGSEQSGTEAFLLDRDGAVAAELPPFQRDLTWADEQNGEFAVIDRTFSGELTLHRFSPFGPRADIPLPSEAGSFEFGFAASPDRFLSIRTTGSSQWLTIRDTAGRMISTTNEPPCPTPGHDFIRAWWDGAQFVTACRLAGELWATRFSADGAQLGTSRLSTTVETTTYPIFATNGSTQLLLWSDRAFSKSGDLVAYAGAETRLVSYSGRAQHAVRIARVREHRAAIWLDDTQTRIESQVDGKTVSVDTPAVPAGRPAIAGGERTFLTAWTVGDSSPLFARRLGLSGEVLDPQPIASERTVNTGDSTPGVAFRAPAFVIAAPAFAGPVAMSVTEEGARTELTPPARADSFQPFWAGSELRYGVATLAGRVAQSPGIFTYSWTFSVALPGATSIRSREFLVTDLSRAAIAPGPGRLLCAWIEDGKVVVAQLSLDGTRVLIGPLDIAGQSAATEIEALWNGSEYVVAWSGRADGEVVRRILAMRFDSNGLPLDATPLAISPPGATMDKPSLAATGAGADIAYSRYDDSNGGAPRAYVRSLDRALLSRRTSARH